MSRVSMFASFKSRPRSITDLEMFIAEVLSAFPDALRLTGDQLEAEAASARHWLRALPVEEQERAAVVVQSLEKKAKRLGPAFALRIPCVSKDDFITCVVRPNDLFIFGPGSVEDQTWQPIKALMKNIASDESIEINAR